MGKRAACISKADVQAGILVAVDLYRRAVLLARERDLQAEAQAFSGLGKLYMVGRWGRGEVQAFSGLGMLFMVGGWGVGGGTGVQRPRVAVHGRGVGRGEACHPMCVCGHACVRACVCACICSCVLSEIGKL